MLNIKTVLQPSKLHGVGLFANENIEKGRVVWEYCSLVDITYSKREWHELEKQIDPCSFIEIKKYAYKEKDCYILCTDNAQFMNHCENNFNVSNTNDLQEMFAIKSIKKGEEILCNYFEYSDYDDHHIHFLKHLNLSKDVLMKRT